MKSHNVEQYCSPTGKKLVSTLILVKKQNGFWTKTL